MKKLAAAALPVIATGLLTFGGNAEAGISSCDWPVITSRGAQAYCTKADIGTTLYRVGLRCRNLTTGLIISATYGNWETPGSGNNAYKYCPSNAPTRAAHWIDLF